MSKATGFRDAFGATRYLVRGGTTQQLSSPPRTNSIHLLHPTSYSPSSSSIHHPPILLSIDGQSKERVPLRPPLFSHLPSSANNPITMATQTVGVLPVASIEVSFTRALSRVIAKDHPSLTLQINYEEEIRAFIVALPISGILWSWMQLTCRKDHRLPHQVCSGAPATRCGCYPG